MKAAKKSKDSQKLVENPGISGRERHLYPDPALPLDVRPGPSPLYWVRAHAGAAGGQPGPWWRPVGQLGIAMWQVALANPREDLGGARKDTHQTPVHLSEDMCPTIPSSHPRPHSTRVRTADAEGSLGLLTS